MSSKSQGTTIYVFSLQGQFIESFTSARMAKKYFNSNKSTIMKYARSGKIFRDQYILSLENKI